VEITYPCNKYIQRGQELKHPVLSSLEATGISTSAYIKVINFLANIKISEKAQLKEQLNKT